MTITPPETDLVARVEALETDRENMYECIGLAETGCHDTVRRQKADRKLLLGLRTTQIEHEYKLDKLLDGQDKLERSQHRLERSQPRLLEGHAHIEQEFAGLKKGQARLAADVSGLKTDMASVKEDVSGLKTDMASVKEDVSGLKTDVSGLKDGLARLERIVRKGFGMAADD